MEVYSVKYIRSSTGRIYAVCDCHFYLVAGKSWQSTTTGYARTTLPRISGKQPQVLMHRLITGARPGELTDHKSGDRTNNCCWNLRICSSADNARNRPGQGRRASPRGSQYHSSFKGVHWVNSARRWRARIVVNGKMIHLGQYVDQNEAARSYNQAAERYFGEFAVLNVLQ